MMTRPYRHKITLLKRKLTKNSMGEAVETWEEVGVLRGAVKFLRGHETWRGPNVSERQAQTEAQVNIRHRRGLNPADFRVVYGPTTFDLQAVIEDEGHHTLQLMLKAHEAQQEPGGQVNA